MIAIQYFQHYLIHLISILQFDNYIFSGDPKIRVNRKTLLVSNKSSSKSIWVVTPYSKCNEISTDRFYELVEEKLKERKKKIKF